MHTRYLQMIEWSLINFIFTISIICIYYYFYKKKRYSELTINRSKFNYADFIILMLLIFISGFRCNSGSDYYNYYYQYINSTIWFSSLSGVFFSRFQSGYITLAYIVKDYIGGESSIFLIISFMMYVPLIKFLKKRSASPWQSFALWVLLGYFSMSMNIIKQYLAMSVIFFAFDSFYFKKYFKYCAFSLIAMWFHVSSIYCILCIPLAIFIKKTRTLYRGILLCSFIGIALIDYVISEVIFIFPVRYHGYINSFITGSYDKKLMLGGMLVALFYSFLISISVIKINKLKNKYFRGILNLSILMMPFLLLSIKTYIFNRVAYFGIQLLIVIFPSVFSAYRSKFNKYIFICIILTYSLSFSILCAENNYYHYGSIFYEQPMSVQEFVQLYK